MFFDEVHDLQNAGRVDDASGKEGVAIRQGRLIVGEQEVLQNVVANRLSDIHGVSVESQWDEQRWLAEWFEKVRSTKW